MPVFGFALGLAYVPAIISGAITGRFALAAVVLPLLLVKPRLTLGHALWLAWIAYAALSLAWSPDRANGAEHLVYLGLGFAAFCIGAERPLRGFARGAALAMGLNGVLALAQVHGFAGIWEGPVPGGLFYNKNYLAEAAGLTALLCLLHKDWTFAALCLPAIALARCREVELALALALVVWAWQHDKTWLLALTLCAIGFAALRADPHTLAIRLAMWIPTAEHLQLAGHGLGSFYVAYPVFGPFADGRPEYPHNEYLYSVFELGLGALAPLALALWCFAQRALRPALLAVATMASLSFPLQLPFSLVLISLLAGRCARERRSLRSIYAKWRDRLSTGLGYAHS